MANFRSIFIPVALISLASQVSSNKDGTKTPSLLNLILYIQVNGQQWLTDIVNQISDEAAAVANMTGSQETWNTVQAAFEGV